MYFENLQLNLFLHFNFFLFSFSWVTNFLFLKKKQMTFSLITTQYYIFTCKYLSHNSFDLFVAIFVPKSYSDIYISEYDLGKCLEFYLIFFMRFRS